MITRFFKRKKEPPEKKGTQQTPKVKMKPEKKVLTAEGWKRIMMGKKKKEKKPPKEVDL